MTVGVQPGQSTGPQTALGKAIASQNSLTHGLSRSKVTDLVRADEIFQRRYEALDALVQPRNTHQIFCLENAVYASIVAEDCLEAIENQVETVVREAKSDVLWKNARKIEVLEHLAKLGKDPCKTIAELRKTAQGVRTIYEFWEDLLSVLEVRENGWNENELKLAANLLGMPPGLDSALSRLQPPACDDFCCYQLSICHEQLAELEHLQTELARESEERERAARQTRAGALEDIRVRRFLRYYNDASRRYLRFMKEAGWEAPAVPGATSDKTPKRDEAKISRDANPGSDRSAAAPVGSKPQPDAPQFKEFHELSPFAQELRALDNDEIYALAKALPIKPIGEYSAEELETKTELDFRIHCLIEENRLFVGH